MKSPVFISGNQDKIDCLSKTLGIDLIHQKIDLDEIQSADPKIVIEHKVKQAYSIVHMPVLVEDTSLSFNALNGLAWTVLSVFIIEANSLYNSQLVNNYSIAILIADLIAITYLCFISSWFRNKIIRIVN